jgi:hypothetical protein
MLGGKIFGIFGLIAQCAAVCFWTYEAGTAAWLAATDPEHQQHLAASILLITTSAAIAAGTAYCLYRQFKWAQENKHFTAWLVANAEKIRTNQTGLLSQPADHARYRTCASSPCLLRSDSVVPHANAVDHKRQ